MFTIKDYFGFGASNLGKIATVIILVVIIIIIILLILYILRWILSMNYMSKHEIKSMENITGYSGKFMTVIEDLKFLFDDLTATEDTTSE